MSVPSEQEVLGSISCAIQRHWWVQYYLPVFFCAFDSTTWKWCPDVGCSTNILVFWSLNPAQWLPSLHTPTLSPPLFLEISEVVSYETLDLLPCQWYPSIPQISYYSDHWIQLSDYPLPIPQHYHHLCFWRSVEWFPMKLWIYYLANNTQVFPNYLTILKTGSSSVTTPSLCLWWTFVGMGKQVITVMDNLGDLGSMDGGIPYTQSDRDLLHRYPER